MRKRILPPKDTKWTMKRMHPYRQRRNHINYVIAVVVSNHRYILEINEDTLRVIVALVPVDSVKRERK